MSDKNASKIIDDIVVKKKPSADDRASTTKEDKVPAPKEAKVSTPKEAEASTTNTPAVKITTTKAETKPRKIQEVKKATPQTQTVEQPRVQGTRSRSKKLKAQTIKKVQKLKDAKKAKNPKKIPKKYLLRAVIAIALIAVTASIVVVLTVANPFDAMIGKYELTRLTIDDEDQSSLIETLFRESGFVSTIEINAGRNGKITIFGESDDFTYGNGKIHFKKGEFGKVIDSENGEEDEEIKSKITKDIDYAFKDDTIIIKAENTELFFTAKKD